MADLKLKDGTEITFDLDAFTYEEYFNIFEKDDKAYTTSIVAKAAGLSLESVASLGFMTTRRLIDAFFKKCRDPLSDPNSDSAPISE